jgi:hypothetical protein
MTRVFKSNVSYQRMEIITKTVLSFQVIAAEFITRALYMTSIQIPC